MKFQLATDYAIRILCCLYENDNRLLTAAQLSEELGITYLYFMKLTGILRQAGLVRSVQGCNGGYQLARNAEKASVYDVVKVIEGDIRINRCLEGDHFCSRDATQWCPMCEFFKKLQDDFIAQLKSRRICDLCEVKKERENELAVNVLTG